MTSAISPAQNPINTPSPVSASGKASSLPAAPAQQTKPSYASATRPAPSTTSSTSNTPSSTTQSTTGAGAPAQHGKIDTVTRESQMSATPPAVGTQQGVSGSTPNGVSRTDSHGRKPSVVISASGTTGQIPNGGPVGQNGRPNISFGSMMNPQGSPAVTNSVPFASQTLNMPTPRHDPRIISPAHSPAPIPQPPASGGKPPSGLQSHGNGLSFGSMGMENGDANMRNPPTPGQQPAHLRRESSQSGHSDVSGIGIRGGFVPPSGRGRGGYMPQYGAAHSPAQGYRQLSNSRGPPNMPPQFQGQPQMANSGFRGRNSPALMHAQPHMPQGMPNSSQMHYGGYPQHLGPQQSAMYGMQQFDPYSGYYQPYYPGSQYSQGAPPSPRPGQQYPSPYSAPPQHMHSPYPPSMSRSASQASERPASSMGQRPHGPSGGPPSQTPTPGPQSATPGPQSNTPAPPAQSNFQIPQRNKSKAIVIKNAQGEEVHFDKKPSPTPVPRPQSPAVVTSAPTPPPRTPSTQHIRTESRTTKTDAEVKNSFQEQVRKQMEARREQERKEKVTTEDKAGADVKDTSEADAKAASDKADADAKVAKDKADAEAKADADAKAAKEKADLEAKADADAKAAKDKADAEAKAAKDKEDADAKAEKDKTDAAAKAQAEKEQAETEAKAAKEKSDAEAAAQADNARAVTDAEKEAAPEPAEDEGARLKREEDERLEQEIAEMEALEREEEERERKYSEKKAKEMEERKKREAAAALNADDEMKRMEREAEEREVAREKEREQEKEQGQGESETSKADHDLFASLKKPALGPGATAAASGEESPVSEEPSAAAGTPEGAASSRPGIAKPRPSQLKLQTDKPVEPAQPTPGMQALKSARILDLQQENINYPEGVKSPNPALNQTAGKRGGNQYDKSFLLQFQDVFKEKPTVDWDQKVKDTLGDGEPASARASNRVPSSVMGRQPSNRPQAGMSFPPMGSFAGASGPRTLPAGTTSQERFLAASSGQRPAGGNPLAGFPGRPGAFPMGAQPMSRTNSLQAMAPPSPRGGQSRGKGSRRGPADRAMSRKEEEQHNKAMPLTAHLDLKPLEKGATGWTARSIGQPISAASAVGPDGMMPPDMVQRKVKAALNKMTPDNFPKITDQVMEIAGQSKNETDGRTLRQVIQLTFEKACDEAHWAGMYAQFCQKMLTHMSNEIVDETIRDRNQQPVVGGGLFRKYLLNRCQEEFERGWEVNLPDKPEGENQEAALLSDEYYVAAAAKRRGLGLIQFIGELYKLGMLTYRIMHQCVLKLLNFEGQPDESAIENLSKLLRTVGATMDNAGEQPHGLVNAYFDRINNILDAHKDLASRPRFMLMDIVDLRKHAWKDNKGLKGPKTIQEIHAEAEAAAAAAEAEKLRHNTRGGPGGRMPAGRGDARNFSNQGMPPPDYPRNQVGMDDLRRLQARGGQSRQASSGLGPSLGPGSSLYAGRSSSGRKGLGPPKDGEASGASTRTNTPPSKKEDKDEKTHSNAFSALAALENEGPEASVHSPPSEKTSPQQQRATPSIDSAADAPTS